MSHRSPEPEERESVPPALAALFAVLDEPGALAPHDEQAARAQVNAALDQALGVRRRSASRRLPRVWLVAAMVFGAGGVLAAVGHQYLLASSTREAAGEAVVRGTSNSHPAPPTEDSAAPSNSSAAGAVTAVERETVGSPVATEKASGLAKEPNPDLLAEANRLRRAGQTAEAVRVYLRVVTQSPSTQSAYVARVAAGQLLITASPKRALTLFREAHKSRPNGPLEREIQLGIERASTSAPQK